MYDIFLIANWFLTKDSMTHKKLQKLCYYAQGWTLALLHKPLINDYFEAWVHGPVNKNLYEKYKSYGWNDIEKIEYKIDFPFTDNELTVLESVYNTYGNFNGEQLEWSTHQEKPWLNARKDLGEWEPSNNIILNEDMQKYYSSIYVGD